MLRFLCAQRDRLTDLMGADDAFGRKQAAKGKAVSEAKGTQTIPLAKRKEEA